MIQLRRILLCLRYGIGDAVMEMPALRGLRQACPEAEICLLGARPALELFEGDPDFQALVCIHDFGFTHWGDLGDATLREQFRHWFLEAGFDCVLDPFHAVFGVQETLTQSGVPWRNSNPLPKPVPGDLSGGHGMETIWQDAVHNWGLQVPARQSPPGPEPYIGRQAHQAARDFLQHCWPDTEQAAPVGIAPIASSNLKRWPLERVCDIVEWLARERGETVLVFGLDPSDPLAARLQKAGGRDAVAILPPSHLQQTAALAARCRAFVSNDTGLMHLAAAVDTSTLGIFGPTAAHIYLPPAGLAVSSTRPCDYRLQDRFGPPQCVHDGRCLVAEQSCIATIGSASVREALDSLLSEGPAYLNASRAAGATFLAQAQERREHD